VESAVTVGEFFADENFGYHPIARDFDDFRPHQLGKGRLHIGDRLEVTGCVGGIIGIQVQVPIGWVQHRSGPVFRAAMQEARPQATPPKQCFAIMVSPPGNATAVIPMNDV
jgi:hypothetical protein